MARLTAVGKGFPHFTLHTHPPKPLVLSPLEQWKIWTSRFRCNNINYSSLISHIIFLKEFISDNLSENNIKRKKLKKEQAWNNLVVDDTNEQLQHVGILKKSHFYLFICTKTKDSVDIVNCTW